MGGFIRGHVPICPFRVAVGTAGPGSAGICGGRHGVTPFVLPGRQPGVEVTHLIGASRGLRSSLEAPHLPPAAAFSEVEGKREGLFPWTRFLRGQGQRWGSGSGSVMKTQRGQMGPEK